MSDILRLIRAEGVKLFGRKLVPITLAALICAAAVTGTVFSLTMDKFDLDAQMIKLSENYSKKIDETEKDEKLTDEQKRSNIAKYEAYIDGIREMAEAGYTPYDWQGQIYLQMISVDAQIKYIKSDPAYFGENADPERRAGAEGLIRVLTEKKSAYRKMMDDNNWRVAVEAELAEANKKTALAEEKGETDENAVITKEICELRLEYGIVPSYLTNALVSDFNINISGQFTDEIIAAVKAMLGTDWHNGLLEDIKEGREALAGINRTGKSDFAYLDENDGPTQEERERISASIDRDLYRLENDIAASSDTVYGAVCAVMMKFLLAVLTICVTVAAGRIMSDEFIGGTVKFMILTPYRRSKIWLAKYLTVIIFAVIGTVLACAVTILMSGLYFGFDGIGGYVLADFGKGELPFTVNLLVCFFVNSLQTLFMLTLAYMLSCLTRSSATSIGITLAYLFTGTVAITFISNLNPDLYKKVWLHNEMTVNLQNLISPESFVFANSDLVITASHSILVSVIFFAVLNTVSFISFTKRDVKL